MIRVKYSSLINNLDFLKYNNVKYSVSRVIFNKTRNLSHYVIFHQNKPIISHNSKYNVVKLINSKFYSTELTKVKEESDSLSPEDTKTTVPEEIKFDVFKYNTDELVFEPDTARQYCDMILDDPISDITVSESSRFVIPFPNSDVSKFKEFIDKTFTGYDIFDGASTMVHLCVERLENDELTKAFEIGHGYNKRAYFLTLHVWLIYRRVMKEMPEGPVLKDRLMRIYHEVFKDWLWKRNIPSYNFKAEYQNTQYHMVKFMIELDRCTSDEDFYPYKLSALLKKMMYEDLISDETVDLLVKYVIRQFIHLDNIEKNYFMAGNFLWADVEEICKPAKLLKRAMPQLIMYMGYRGVEPKKIEDPKVQKLT